MDSKQAVTLEIEALNRQDVDGVMAFYRDDVVFDDVSLPEPLRGAAAMREYMAQFFTAIPDLHIEVHSLFGDERVLAAEYDLFGTHLGDLDGHPPSGNTFRVRALSVYEYDGERFGRETFYWDSATMLRQLGLS